jgi:hypothetical protein
MQSGRREPRDHAAILKGFAHRSMDRRQNVKKSPFRASGKQKGKSRLSGMLLKCRVLRGGSAGNYDAASVRQRIISPTVL